MYVCIYLFIIVVQVIIQFLFKAINALQLYDAIYLSIYLSIYYLSIIYLYFIQPYLDFVQSLSSLSHKKNNILTVENRNLGVM